MASTEVKATSHTTDQVDVITTIPALADDANAEISQPHQLRPIGPHPSVDILLIGALLWSAHSPALHVLAHVCDDDTEHCATATVLAVIRALTIAGKPTCPQLVFDELRRYGAASPPVPNHLKLAVTSGAEPLAVNAYAAAVVAASLRRRVASVGHAMIELASAASEADLAIAVAYAAASVEDTAARLAVLRAGS